jgi:hypothetical protein
VKVLTVALVLIVLGLLLVLGILMVRTLFYPGPLGGLDQSRILASAALIPHGPNGG